MLCLVRYQTYRKDSISGEDNTLKHYWFSVARYQALIPIVFLLLFSVLRGLSFNLCKKILAQAYLRPSLSVLIWLKLPAFGGGGIQQGFEYPNTYLGSIK